MKSLASNPLQGDHPALTKHSPTSAAAPLLESTSLLQGEREIQIRHQGQIYRLQATRQGKLILTK